MARLVVLSEDYGEQSLLMTDCDNNQLEQILMQIEENDENGIGKTPTQICEELFPYSFITELANTEDSQYDCIKELKVEPIAWSLYLTFSVVQSEKEI